ncbi:hypothetical protein V6N13_121190 [Hibiscus sabdariffa]
MDPRLREAAETGNTDALYVLIGDDPDILERIDQIPFVQTPLHVAANQGLGVTTGNCRLLVSFLEACPECIEDVTVRDETAFHLALKEDQIEAFNILIGWLQRTRRTHVMAVLFACMQALKLLLDSQLWLHVKAEDSDGWTALQYIKRTNRRGVNINRNESEVETKIKQLKDKVTFERIRVLGDRTRLSMSVDMINTMQVITALVITAIYTSSLSPPGGVWQDNGDNNTAAAPAPAPSLKIAQTYPFSNNILANTSKILIFGDKTERAGTTIMNQQIYGVFWFLNLATFGFTVTDLVTVFLLSSFHLLLFLAIPLYMLLISYFCSMTILAPTISWAYVNLFFMVLFGFFPFLLFFSLLIFSKSIRQKKAEFRYRNQMREALGMNLLGPSRTLMFCSQYILDGIFGLWMPSA